MILQPVSDFIHRMICLLKPSFLRADAICISTVRVVPVIVMPDLFQNFFAIQRDVAVGGSKTPANQIPSASAR